MTGGSLRRIEVTFKSLLFEQDLMVQRIVEGCPCLLYLNLSCTLITNKTLRELSR